MEEFINKAYFRCKSDTKMDMKPLERIGLTKSEIAVYLALLKLGQTTAGPIVDEARVTRSKIYDILERLKNKGLVSYIVKESTKHFSAANPNNILEYVSKKEQELRQERTQVEKLLPELMARHAFNQDKKTAEISTGMNGMKNAFNTLISEFQEKEHFYAFGAGEGKNVPQMQLFFNNLHKKRTEKKVRTHIIFNESAKGMFRSQEKSSLVEARYIAQTTPASINLYKDYTVIAILNEEPITILIKNKETSESFKEYFNIMWKVAK